MLTYCSHSLPSAHSAQRVVVSRSHVFTVGASAASASPANTVTKPTFTKPTLFDVPVSNNGARIRLVLYKKGLENAIDIKKPTDIGGLKSPEYLAFNPLGLMPLLVTPDGTGLYESQVIETYLLDKYQDQGPSLLPSTPELRAKAALATRLHDLYIATIQGCMYKPDMTAEARHAQLTKINFHLNNLETLLASGEGPFVVGKEFSFADSALIPTFVFMTFILPQYFGWRSVFTGRPALEAWWKAVNDDVESARVIAEVTSGLQAWADGKRWEEKGISAQVESCKEYDWTLGN